jgi:hypothetical protein
MISTGPTRPLPWLPAIICRGRRINVSASVMRRFPWVLLPCPQGKLGSSESGTGRSRGVRGVAPPSAARCSW